MPVWCHRHLFVAAHRASVKINVSHALISCEKIIYGIFVTAFSRAVASCPTRRENGSANVTTLARSKRKSPLIRHRNRYYRSSMARHLSSCQYSILPTSKAAYRDPVRIVAAGDSSVIIEASYHALFGKLLPIAARSLVRCAKWHRHHQHRPARAWHRRGAAL